MYQWIVLGMTIFIVILLVSKSRECPKCPKSCDNGTGWKPNGTYKWGKYSPQKQNLTYNDASDWVDSNYPCVKSWIFFGDWKDPNSKGNVGIPVICKMVQGDGKTFTGASQVFIRNNL
jgi:hypothetical protein